MPGAERSREPKGAGSRKVPGAGRCQRSPEEPENRAREKSKEPEKPGRSPRSPEGAERKRGARRTTGPSSVFLSSFVCLASRWPAAPPTVCRHPACFVRFSSCSAGRWPVVPRAVLRPLADFVCRACSVGSVGSIGPLVRRVHWRRRGSVDARTLPPPGLAPDEKCTRPEPPARMPTTEPLRAQNLLARTCPAWDISVRNISAQNVPVRAISPLGRPAPDTFTQEAPLRPSLPDRSRTPPLRRETPRDGS